jgi:hypothetical protein
LGIALFFWLFDAPTGYHQLAVSSELQKKLAFQGTDAIKWAYTVMPCGPTKQMIHDLGSAWKDLATWSGISVDDNTNTNIIVDDIFNGLYPLTVHYNTWNASCGFAKLIVSPLV